MKIDSKKVAAKLNLHPATFFLLIRSVDNTLVFEDIWPEIDEEWLEALTALKSKGAYQAAEEQDKAPVQEKNDKKSSVSHNSIHVLDKMNRKKLFGNNSLQIDALINLTHLGEKDVKQAVDEIRRLGLLHHDGTSRDGVSLDSGKKSIIEEVLQEAEHCL